MNFLVGFSGRGFVAESEEGLLSNLKDGQQERLYDFLNCALGNDDWWGQQATVFKHRLFKVAKEKLRGFEPAASGSSSSRVNSIALEIIHSDDTVYNVLIGDSDEQILEFTPKQMNQAVGLSEVFDFDFKSRLEAAISEKTGTRLETDDSDNTIASIENFSDIETLTKCLHLLDPITLKIKMSPNKDQDLDQLIAFSEEFGELITDLDLRKMGDKVKNSEKKIIENVSNLSALFIKGCEISEEITELLVDKGKSVDQIKINDITLLLYVCEQGHKELAKLLLEKGADVNKAEENGRTSLFTACFQGNKEIVKLLLEKGADVNKALNGETPLVTACKLGHKEVAELLLEKGADVNEIINNDNLLEILCQMGKKEIIEFLLEKGADVNKVMGNGMTPLFMVCFLGQKEIAQLFLQKGAGVNKAMKNGETPLLVACKRGKKETAELLLEKGADVNKAMENGMTPLLTAFFQGHKEVIELLLEKGADVNKAMEDGTTPLYIACEKGIKEVVQLLLEKGADVNKALENGATPLYIACQKGIKEVVQLLLEKGADVNKAMEDGTTPLHLACRQGNKEITELLMEKGANYDDFFYISEYLEQFIGHLDIQEYLNSGDGDELLIKHLDHIFTECSNLRKYIENNRPLELFPQFYPIEVSMRPGGILQITCNRCHLLDDNLKIFNKLAPHFKDHPAIGIKVTYRGEAGIDAGGLGRDFISNIFQYLSVNKDLQKSIPGGNSEWLVDVGRVVSWLNHMGGHYTVGECFHPSIFKAVLDFSYDEIIGDFENISPSRAFEIYELYNEEPLKGLKEFIAWDGSEEGSADHLDFLREQVEILMLEDIIKINFDKPDYELIQESINQWKKALYEETYMNSVMNLRLFAKGMGYDRVRWKFLQGLGCKQLQKTIEGNFSKEELLEKIMLPDDFGDKDDLQEELRKWINNHSEAELRTFLKYLTGSPSLPAGDNKIILHLCLGLDVQVATCSSSIGIPRGYTDVDMENDRSPEDVMSKDVIDVLDWCIGVEDDGFGMG
jgi:ankyrin repeat protein